MSLGPEGKAELPPSAHPAPPPKQTKPVCDGSAPAPDQQVLSLDPGQPFPSALWPHARAGGSKGVFFSELKAENPQSHKFKVKLQIQISKR